MIAVPRHRPLFDRSSQAGFSLPELFLVFFIIGVIQYLTVPTYVGARASAMDIALKKRADQFTAAVSLAHGEGMAQRSSLSQSTFTAYIIINNRNVYLNEFGYPANATARMDPRSGSQTAYECHQLWSALLTNPPSAGLLGDNLKDIRYLITKLDNVPVCRYTLVTPEMGSRYFDYNLKTGQTFLISH